MSNDELDSQYEEPMRLYDFDDAIVELLDRECYGDEPRERLTAERLEPRQRGAAALSSGSIGAEAPMELTGTYFERLGVVLYRDLILPYFPDMRRRIDWTIPDLASDAEGFVLMRVKDSDETPLNYVFTRRGYIDDPTTLVPQGPYNTYRDLGVKWCSYKSKWRYCCYAGGYSHCPNVYNGRHAGNMMRLDSGRCFDDKQELDSLPYHKEKKLDFKNSRCILPCGLHLIFSRHDPPDAYLANWDTLQYLRIKWPHSPDLATDDFGKVCVPPPHAAATWRWLTFMPIECHTIDDLEECK